MEENNNINPENNNSEQEELKAFTAENNTDSAEASDPLKEYVASDTNNVNNGFGTPNNGYGAPNNGYGYGAPNNGGYGVPNAYTPGYDPREAEKNKKGTTSLIFGVLSLVCCNPLCLFSILAIVFAGQSRAMSRDGKYEGTALAGLICGIIGIVVFILSALISLVNMGAILGGAGSMTFLLG